MFHRVYHVTTKAHSTQDCPEPPKGLLIVPRRAWSFWAFMRCKFGHAPRGAVCASLGGLGRSQALQISPRRTTYANCSRLRQTWTSVTKIYLDRFLRFRFREIKPFNQRSTTAIV